MIVKEIVVFIRSTIWLLHFRLFHGNYNYLPNYVVAKMFKIFFSYHQIQVGALPPHTNTIKNLHDTNIFGWPINTQSQLWSDSKCTLQRLLLKNETKLERFDFV